MADENKPAFYPRVGRTIAKNFRSAQPLAFIEDPRAMDLPQFGDVDLSVPSKENLEMARRMAERDAQLKRQQQADRSPLEKLAGGLQAGRFMGSALTQAINSAPTRLFKGDEAADKFIQERIYKPEQPLAYEYAQDIGDFLEKLETEYKIPPVLPEAMALQYVTAPATSQATRAAGRGVEQAGMAMERGMEPVVRGALEQGGLPREMAMAMGANTQSNVIKPKGGNWFGTSVQDAMSGLKRGVIDEDAARRLMGDDFVNERMADPVDQALNKWVDSNLTNYVKKQMATPEDPVRKLAEEGVVHFPVAEDPRYWSRKGETAREDLGGTEMAKSDLAKQWENRTDSSINRETAQMNQDMMHLAPGLYTEADEWIKKLPPDTPIYSGNRLMNPADLGFDHIIDVLREDIAAGRIRPEQLSKVSMEQAVRRTFEYDQELAKKMNEARATARAELPVYKEYPEGYRWVELNKPGSFAAESDAMGHSVRGYEPPKGHPDWTEGSGDSGSSGYGYGGWEGIKSGRAKVYSLIDSKGEPHVTIETKAPNLRSNYDELQPLQMQADREADAQNFKTFAEREKFADKRYQELKAQLMAQKKPEGDYTITQIKGKQNAAPKEDYLPYVQDFVRGGNWADVRDFKNTGLEWHTTGPQGIFMQDDVKALEQAGYKVPKYLTTAEKDDLAGKLYELQTGNDYNTGLPKVPPAKGMKRGGVAISNNPDAMMLELNNQKMAKGGLTKLLRAAPKSKAEIDVIARRMAPQLLGEFVRGEKGTQSVAGKTQKQFAKEKEMVHDIRPTGAERPLPKEVDIEELKDQVMVGIAGDPTISGQTLYSVDGVPLDSPSPQHGGPFYGLGRDDAFWASGLSAANRVQNVAREASEQYDLPVLGNYVMMGPDSINYAQHYADANLAAIDLNKMNRAQVEAFNNLVREGYPYKKKGEDFMRQRVFPAFPGIENPSEAYLHFSIDPELRKYFNALMQMPTVTEKYNLPSGIDIRHAVTEPDLRDLEIGVTGKSIGRLRPEVSKLGLSEHPTYSHDIPGEFLGTSKYPVPYELSFPDTVKSVRENPKQAPQEFGSFKYVGPRQVIDQQLIDEIKQYQEMIKKYTGKKEGGYIKKPAAYLNGDEFVNAAKKYGIKDSMNNLNKIVDLVNKGLSVDDAARQVADSGTHKAAGGAIRGDDLILEERPL